MYVFQNELFYYCELHATILRKCSGRFSRMISAMTNIHSFYDKSCMTIASLAMKI